MVTCAMKSTLKALIFDVDGTLADTEADGHRLAFNKAFVGFGLDWNWDVETYGKLLAVTGGKERMKFYATDFLPNKKIPTDLDNMIPKIHKVKTSYYTDLLATGAIPLRSGVKRLLNEARERGYRLAIATTTTPDNVTALLMNTLGKESLDWFEVIAAGDMVPHKKPATDVYDYALEKMALKPEECIAFEDSQNGNISSINAGIKTIVTPVYYTKDHSFDGAGIVIDHMGEPDDAFSVLEGDAEGFTFLNCAMIEMLHSRE